jgi:hypothetical protein
VRPPILTEQAIRAAVRELGARGRRVTGVAVRRLLAERYGARGGVSRVYRLLDEVRGEERDRMTARSQETRASASGEAREAAIARADLAEHRERVHQERWARETDSLRARVAAAEQAARDSEALARRVAELAQALASAQARIAQLERQLDDGR